MWAPVGHGRELVGHDGSPLLQEILAIDDAAFVVLLDVEQGLEQLRPEHRDHSLHRLPQLSVGWAGQPRVVLLK